MSQRASVVTSTWNERDIVTRSFRDQNDRSRLILISARAAIEDRHRLARALLSMTLMKVVRGRWDVFLAVATVGAVSAWGDSPTRLVDVSCILSLWLAYFGASAARLFSHKRKLQPALAK
jgi:hypothetical protein